jgi:hypothetical protein
VLAQPSMPVTIGRRRRHNIDISPDDLAVVKGRCADGLRVVGLRFAGDRLVSADRFAFLREQLGEAFVAVEIPDDAAHPDTPGPPHSTLTEHLVDAPDTPTHTALQRVLTHFRENLLTPEV